MAKEPKDLDTEDQQAVQPFPRGDGGGVMGAAHAAARAAVAKKLAGPAEPDYDFGSTAFRPSAEALNPSERMTTLENQLPPEQQALYGRLTPDQKLQLALQWNKELRDHPAWKNTFVVPSVVDDAAADRTPVPGTPGSLADHAAQEIKETPYVAEARKRERF